MLIFNFRPEIEFTDNSSINFSWQIGNKYEIRSEKCNFYHFFLIRTFALQAMLFPKRKGRESIFVIPKKQTVMKNVSVKPEVLNI